MGTRANMVITDSYFNSVFLYHHLDGYPSYLGKQIINIFTKNKYIDSGNAFFSATEIIKAKNIKEADKTWELTNMLHSDIEFLYIVNTEDKFISCYKIERCFGKEMLWLCHYANEESVKTTLQYCKDYEKREAVIKWLGLVAKHFAKNMILAKLFCGKECSITKSLELRKMN